MQGYTSRDDLDYHKFWVITNPFESMKEDWTTLKLVALNVVVMVVKLNGNQAVSIYRRTLQYLCRNVLKSDFHSRIWHVHRETFGNENYKSKSNPKFLHLVSEAVVFK